MVSAMPDPLPTAGIPASGSPRRAVTWRDTATVMLAALVTVGAVDWAIQQRVYPVPPRMAEVVDGLESLATRDPHLLVLGSSHARSFEPLGRALEAQLQKRTTLLPVEWGKMSSYEWVMNHRVRPLLAAHAKPSLERVLLVTEWWDGCRPAEGLGPNIPSRAWTFLDFLRDVAAHGLTAWNQNYLWAHVQHALTRSVLLRDRGVGQILDALRDRVAPRSAESIQADFDNQVASWHRMTESAANDPLCRDGVEMAALSRILDDLRREDVAVTIVVFPRMPSTMTEVARRSTFPKYLADLHGVARPRGIPVIDWTFTAPLSDVHFMKDFDHLTLEGRETLCRFALDGDLDFLLDRRSWRAEPGAGEAARE